MASYAPNYTPRYRAKYVSAGVQHHIQIRCPRGTGASTLIANGQLAINQLAVNLASYLPTDFAFLEGAYALTDSDIFLPAGKPADPTGTVDPALYTGVMKVVATTFTGKSAASKTRVSLFGLYWLMEDVGGTPADGIVYAAEDSHVQDAVDDLNGAGFLVGGDGASAAFHSWATIKVNDKLLKEVRKGLIG